MTDSGALRLFVALELPDEWKRALGELQDEMRDALQRRFGDSVRPRWVRPEGIHLTLKFLGATPADRVGVIEAALRLAIPNAPGLSLQMGKVGSFAERRAPRVILAGLGGDTNSLATVVERIETWLAAAGWPGERRSFHPHLTLARLPETLDDATRREVAAVTTASPASKTGSWTVEGVSLMRSYLEPGGARYERIAAFPS